MSRIERILQAIIDGTSYSEAPQSRIEEILLAIKNDTDYLKSPHSRVETLLLAIKDNTDYSDLLQSRIEEILEHKLHNTVYEKDALSRIENLLIDWISKADYYELIGIPPLTFNGNGYSLADYTIYGNTGGVGERTENVFNKNNRGGYYSASSGEFVSDDRYSYFRIPVNVGDVVRMTANGRGAGCAFYNGEYVSMIHYQTSVYTVPEGVDEISNNYNYTFRDSAMVVVNQQLPNEYVPYGYKIPIVCGGETTNIYIGDSKLYDGDKISYSDTGVEIPTINGTNILTVDTAVQPSNVYLKYKGG